MENNDTFNNIHIGTMIKAIAISSGTTSETLASVIHRYHRNSSKIFQQEDMDIEDVVRISYALEHNIPDAISKRYLSHLPADGHVTESQYGILKMELDTMRITTIDSANRCDFLREIHIGQHIRDVAEERGWNEIDMAAQLSCSQGSISNLYKHKSLKIKPLIKISKVLEYNFIAKIYLVRMFIDPVFKILARCIITINPQQIHIIHPDDENFSMLFRRQDDKK